MVIRSNLVAWSLEGNHGVDCDIYIVVEQEVDVDTIHRCSISPVGGEGPALFLVEMVSKILRFLLRYVFGIGRDDNPSVLIIRISTITIVLGVKR